MPWQGNAEISIDRFDVRAHLDYIADVKIEENTYPEVSIMPSNMYVPYLLKWYWFKRINVYDTKFEMLLENISSR